MNSNGARVEGKNSVIVRVKRRREQVAPDSICIVDDESTKKSTSSLASSLQNLTTSSTASEDTSGNAAKKRKGNFVVLRRIETVDEKESGKLDKQTLSCLRKRANSQSTTKPSENATSTTVFVNKGTKVMKSDEYKDVYVVDMEQKTCLDQENPSTRPGIRIFSPITKQLDSAIQLAFTKNDFSSVFELLLQGADVNYQRTASDGLTCLMVAAMHCNTKALSKLLSKGANIYMGGTPCVHMYI